MFQKEDPILETLALTTKIQKNMKQLASRSKLDLEQQRSESISEASGRAQVVQLEAEVKRLKKENRQLIEDNERLCLDLLRIREERRSLKSQLTEQKQYVTYLQQYLKDIKKELLFWMRKPSGGQSQSFQQKETNFEELLAQIARLRKQNDSKQFRLQFLKQEEKRNADTPIKTKHKKLIQTDSRYVPTSSKKGVIEGRKQRGCTSCNYWNLSVQKSEKPQNKKSHKRTKSQLSNLCECHRNYVNSGKFK